MQPRGGARSSVQVITPGPSVVHAEFSKLRKANPARTGCSLGGSNVSLAADPLAVGESRRPVCGDV